MGKCILNFDELGILVQKSDDRHADNDWLNVAWHVNGIPARVDVFPLLKDNGDYVLHHGDVIPPFSLSLDCGNADVVSAVFNIVNAGSYDRSQQKDAVTKQANKIADLITDAYADLLEKYAKLAGDSNVFTDGVDFLRDFMKGFMEFVFSHSILQVIDDVFNELADLFGPPECNGLVLNDYVVFEPGLPDGDLTITKPITSPEKKDGCGDPAQTSLQITMQRVLDVSLPLATAPPPPVSVVPATGESLDRWAGSWTEDSTTPTPRILLTLSDVRRQPIDHRQLIDVVVREDVDLRFGARFVADVSGLPAEQAHVVPYAANVFGSIKPLASHAVAPGNLKVVQVPSIASGGAGPQRGIAGQDRPPVTKAIFKLDYTRANQGGTPIRAQPIIAAGGGPAGSFAESVEAIELRERGVVLCLYEFRSSGAVIGYGVRYIREESVTYSRADVMLVRWTPAG